MQVVHVKFLLTSSYSFYCLLNDVYSNKSKFQLSIAKHIKQAKNVLPMHETNDIAYLNSTSYHVHIDYLWFVRYKNNYLHTNYQYYITLVIITKLASLYHVIYIY